MAGKRQHYIPRFLQRGFLTPDSAINCKDRTWLHLRGSISRLTGIKDVGVETHFYSRKSHDGTPTLDDLITDIESVFLSDLRYAREAEIQRPLDGNRIARLVTHLMLRTAFVRSTFNHAALGVVDEIADIFSSKDNIRSHFRIDDPELEVASSRLVNAAMQAFTEAGIEMPLPLKQRFITYLVRESFDELFSGMDTIMLLFRKFMSESMAKTSAAAHNKFLATDQQNAWELGLRGLKWQTYSSQQMILPDCIAVAQIDGGDLSPLVLAGLDGLEVCVVPIHTNRVMVGCRIGVAPPRLDTLNQSLARCADKFFIASMQMDAFGLSELIGRRPLEIMDAKVADAVAHFRPTSLAQPLADVEGRSSQNLHASASFSYSLTIPPLESREQVVELQRLVQAAVYEQALCMPLDTLEAITFTLDYAGTLASFDHEVDAIAPVSCHELDCGTAVAKSLTVVRHGLCKHHLVFDAYVALLLTSEEGTERHNGLHILISQLGHVAHDVAYKWPFEARREIDPDAATALLLRAAGAMPGHYFAAQLAATTDPLAGVRHAKLFRDAMDSARRVIDAARLRYRLDGNLNVLVNVAQCALSHALAHAAQWLGHRDGLGGLANDNGLMAETTASLELNQWLVLLEGDLRQLYAPGGHFTSIRFFALTRHVERLFWTFQLFPWLTKDGRAYITVPMGNDAAIIDGLRTLPTHTQYE